MRAGFRCEYCLIHEEDILFPHEPDHITAEQHGGPTSGENLAFACYHCNRLKGPNIAVMVMALAPEVLRVATVAELMYTNQTFYAPDLD